jgi:hypothetical protein
MKPLVWLAVVCCECREASENKWKSEGEGLLLTSSMSTSSIRSSTHTSIVSRLIFKISAALFLS